MMDGFDFCNHMERCLELAATAASHGDAFVGSLMTSGALVIAEAYEQVRSLKDPTAHAEIIAIRIACHIRQSEFLEDCALITNVEPCWMCSYAIREARIGTVVILRPVADIGGITSRFPILTSLANSDWQRPPKIIWHPARS